MEDGIPLAFSLYNKKSLDLAIDLHLKFIQIGMRNTEH